MTRYPTLLALAGLAERLASTALDWLAAQTAPRHDPDPPPNMPGPVVFLFRPHDPHDPDPGVPGAMPFTMTADLPPIIVKPLGAVVSRSLVVTPEGGSELPAVTVTPDPSGAFPTNVTVGTVDTVPASVAYTLTDTTATGKVATKSGTYAFPDEPPHEPGDVTFGFAPV